MGGSDPVSVPISGMCAVETVMMDGKPGLAVRIVVAVGGTVVSSTPAVESGRKYRLTANQQ